VLWARDSLDGDLGGGRTNLQVQRRLATGAQHRNKHRHVPDGVPDPEFAQIKLDELIRVTKGAQNALLDLEELEPHELAKLRASYTNLAEKARDPSDESVSEVGIHHVELHGIPQSHADTIDTA
jgi:hypothetical protein